MTLRNAFEDLALESTQNDIKVQQITNERELLQMILFELRILNTHMSLMTDEEITRNDLEDGDRV